jgi:DeoD family purine-nucleoside phosphorylase
LSKPTTIHLHPAAELAERVLLPGDPGRALVLAQLLLERPLMFNHNRGLWGYTGTAADGRPLSVQSTGMGGPSAAIVLHELIELGVRRAIRVGTCGALVAALGLGELVVAHEAIAADGASTALGAGELTHADPVLTDALLASLAPNRQRNGARTGEQRDERAFHHGRIVSTDLFYDPRPHDWSAVGAMAVEMEASSLFAVGAAAGIQVGCLLIVTDTFDYAGARTRIDEHALTAAVETMGRAAAAALA